MTDLEFHRQCVATWAANLAAAEAKELRRPTFANREHTAGCRTALHYATRILARYEAEAKDAADKFNCRYPYGSGC